MTNKIKRINNPLTIIAIFAALAEVNATIAIGLIDASLHSVFIWFVIGFPTLLVILFFLTLNYNTKVMYSPSDFKDDETFVQSLYGKLDNNEKEKTDKEDIINRLSNLELRINTNIEKMLGEIKVDNPKLEEEIRKIKEQLKESTDENIKEFISEFKIDIKLKEKLIEYRNFPAYFVLIESLLKSNANNMTALQRHAKKNYLASGWEDSIGSLFHNDILTGNINNFKINPDFKDDLEKWEKINLPQLVRIRRMIESQETDNENKLTHEQIMERVRKVARRIKI